VVRAVELVDTMAFMFETRFMQRVTEYAATSPALQQDYADYGKKLHRRFTPPTEALGRAMNWENQSRSSLRSRA
jgi:hypothetical protein